MILAVLMNKAPMDGPDGLSVLPFGVKDLVAALVVCAAISFVWLLVAVLMKKKGRPVPLPPSFWYVAGPASAGVAAFLGIAGFAYLSALLR